MCTNHETVVRQPESDGEYAPSDTVPGACCRAMPPTAIYRGFAGEHGKRVGESSSVYWT